MGRERFKEGERDSFFGSFVYDQVVRKDHLLARLNEAVPWQRFTYKLVKYYQGEDRGRESAIRPGTASEDAVGVVQTGGARPGAGFAGQSSGSGPGP